MKTAALAPDSLSPPRETVSAKTRIVDDMAMIRAAAELTRDLNAPNPWIYWADFLGFTILGYAGLFLALGLHSRLQLPVGSPSPSSGSIAPGCSFMN